MRLSSTLTFYFGWHFLQAVLLVYSGLAAVAFIFNVVNHAQRAAGKDAATFAVVIEMALLNLPQIVQELGPFAILFGSMAAFWRLTRSHELVVARAAGISAWQFMLPALGLAALVGIIKVTALTPVSANLLERYEQMQSKYIRGDASLAAISKSGLWLRQPEQGGHSVIHAQRVSPREAELYDVIIIRFADHDRFASRMDAKKARISGRRFELEQIWLSEVDRPPVFFETFQLPTTLTIENLENSISVPETLSFWTLPSFIRLLEGAGFSTARYELYFHSLLADPVLMCAMVLIAATFSLRPTRRGGTVRFVVLGIATGLILFIVMRLFAKLAPAESIPVLLAAWAPTGVALLLGATMILHLEDG
jgi:lipopolysaccharide export system permease protein